MTCHRPGRREAENWFEIRLLATGTLVRDVVSGEAKADFAGVWGEQSEPLHDVTLEALLDRIARKSVTFPPPARSQTQMRALFNIANIFLILAMIACCAGAMAGLIVFLPVVAGAWVLNLIGLLGFEEAHDDRSARKKAALVDGVGHPATATSRTTSQPDGAHRQRPWSPPAAQPRLDTES